MRQPKVVYNEKKADRKMASLSPATQRMHGKYPKITVDETIKSKKKRSRTRSIKKTSSKSWRSLASDNSSRMLKDLVK